MRLVALVVALCPLLTAADDGARLQRELEVLYKHKVLILRTFNSGDELRFDRDGKLVHGGPTGSWTLYSHIAIEGFKIKATQIEIKGQRLFLAPNHEKKAFSPLAREQVTIFLEADSTVPELPIVQEQLMRVFLRPEENFEDLLPPYWKEYLIEFRTAEKGLAVRALKVGGNVLPPRAESAPEPDYSKPARKAKLQGTVVLSVVIGPDGGIQEIGLVKALGMGLDDNALEAVRKWTFQPALQDGVPVAVQIKIEVGFWLD